MTAVQRASRPTTERGSAANVLALPQIASQWKITLIAGVICLGALLLLYLPTAASAVHLWNTSSAYNYAYLIAPISAALIWADRRALARAVPEPTALGAALAGVFALAWLAADLLDIDEGRHIALVGMMQGLALGLLGPRLYKFLTFPLLYLFFLVPTGTFLLEPLQVAAHASNVALLRASGVPVYAEGFLIEVPAGSFLVEPGCAGLNFFLVALALSLLYGRLSYRSTAARVICVGVALATSVIANILRIFLIIGLAQATDRRIDITADHLLYGWGFFGVVILLAMWLGTKIPAAPPAPRVAPQVTLTPAAATPPARRVSAAAAAFVAAVALFPLWAATSWGRPALETHAKVWAGRLGIVPPDPAVRMNGE